MKYSLILLTFLVLACGKTVNKFEGLSEAERDYLRQLGLQKCVSETNKLFRSYKSESSDQFGALERGSYYLHEVKNGSAVLRSTKIQVWKVTSLGIYFIYSSTNAEDSTPSYQFVKLTPEHNATMIDYLQTMRCTSTAGTTSSVNSSRMTYSTEKETNIEDDRKTVTTRTHTYPFNQLALLGGYQYTQKVQTLTRKGEATDVADVNSAGSLTIQNSIELAYPVYTGYAGAQFCIVNSALTIPFTLTCSPSGLPEFNPSELL